MLDLYKQRFIQALRSPDKANANFDRPVFLAVAFSLVARKNKVGAEARRRGRRVSESRGQIGRLLEGMTAGGGSFL